MTRTFLIVAVVALFLVAPRCGGVIVSIPHFNPEMDRMLKMIGGGVFGAGMVLLMVGVIPGPKGA